MDKLAQGRHTPWQEKNKFLREKYTSKMKERGSYPEPSSSSGKK